MTLYKEYVKTKDKGKEIKFTISFNREIVSWATSQPKKIGYQVTIVPVNITDRGNGLVMEEFGAFTGFNDILYEVNRQSKKRLLRAIKILGERKDKYLKQFSHIL